MDPSAEEFVPEKRPDNKWEPLQAGGTNTYVAKDDQASSVVNIEDELEQGIMQIVSDQLGSANSIVEDPKQKVAQEPLADKDWMNSSSCASVSRGKDATLRACTTRSSGTMSWGSTGSTQGALDPKNWA